MAACAACILPDPGVCGGHVMLGVWLMVSLLQVCGDLMLHTQSLAEEINAAILASAHNLHNPASPSHPFGYYDYLAVYHPEERTAAIHLLTSAENG